MASRLQLRRGTKTEHESFTGQVGETTVDTTNDDLRVHDGSTVGGKSVAQGNKYDGIKQLDNAPLKDRAQYDVVGFYAGTEVGGGQFIYDASRPKSDHNGGTVITPEAISAWDGTQANLSVLLDWTGTGTGAFVRVENADRKVRSAWFGSVKSNSINSSAAVKAALIESLRRRTSLVLHSGGILLSTTVAIDNSVVSAWPLISIEGEQSITGHGVDQSNFAGTTIYTQGNDAFDIHVNNFFNESVRASKIAFRDINDAKTGVGIKIRKNSSSYIRGQFFDDLSAHQMKAAVEFVGESTNFNSNYFGTTSINRLISWQCASPVIFNNAYCNLLTMEGSLLHGATDYGVKMVGGDSGGILAIKDTHFEGCEPAGFTSGKRVTRVTLDNVSAESTGDTSGLGLVDGTGVLALYVSNQNYPFVFMPKEYRMPRASTIVANCPIKVSGEGVRVYGAEFVTPVVSNDPTYNQTDKYTLLLSDVPKGVGLSEGQRLFEESIVGSISGTYLSPGVGALPGNLNNYLVPFRGGDIVRSTEQPFTAPSDGNLVFSWVAARESSLNGLERSDFVIDTVNVGPPVGYRWGQHTGAYCLVIPIAAGQTLTSARAKQYLPAWSSYCKSSFYKDFDGLSLSNIAYGFERKKTREITIPANSDITIEESVSSSSPFSMKVNMVFEGGALGVYHFVARGAGGNPTRVLLDDYKSLDADITIADSGFPANSNAFKKDVTNNTASDVNVVITVEYL